MILVNEQLLNSCKMALAATEVQGRIAAMSGQEVPCIDVILIARRMMKEAIALAEGQPVDMDDLVRWGLDELTHQQATEDENSTDEPPADLDPDIWGE